MLSLRVLGDSFILPQKEEFNKFYKILKIKIIIIIKIKLNKK